MGDRQERIGRRVVRALRGTAEAESRVADVMASRHREQDNEHAGDVAELATDGARHARESADRIEQRLDDER